MSLNLLPVLLTEICIISVLGFFISKIDTSKSRVKFYDISKKKDEKDKKTNQQEDNRELKNQFSTEIERLKNQYSTNIEQLENRFNQKLLINRDKQEDNEPIDQKQNFNLNFGFNQGQQIGLQEEQPVEQPVEQHVEQHVGQPVGPEENIKVKKEREKREKREKKENERKEREGQEQGQEQEQEQPVVQPVVQQVGQPVIPQAEAKTQEKTQDKKKKNEKSIKIETPEEKEKREVYIKQKEEEERILAEKKEKIDQFEEYIEEEEKKEEEYKETKEPQKRLIEKRIDTNNRLLAQINNNENDENDEKNKQETIRLLNELRELQNQLNEKNKNELETKIKEQTKILDEKRIEIAAAEKDLKEKERKFQELEKKNGFQKELNFNERKDLFENKETLKSNIKSLTTAIDQAKNKKIELEVKLQKLNNSQKNFAIDPSDIKKFTNGIEKNNIEIFEKLNLIEKEKLQEKTNFINEYNEQLKDEKGLFNTLLNIDNNMPNENLIVAAKSNLEYYNKNLDKVSENLIIFKNLFDKKKNNEDDINKFFVENPTNDLSKIENYFKKYFKDKSILNSDNLKYFINKIFIISDSETDPNKKIQIQNKICDLYINLDYKIRDSFSIDNDDHIKNILEAFIRNNGLSDCDLIKHKLFISNEKFSDDINNFFNNLKKDYNDDNTKKLTDFIEIFNNIETNKLTFYINHYINYKGIIDPDDYSKNIQCLKNIDYILSVLIFNLPVDKKKIIFNSLNETKKNIIFNNINISLNTLIKNIGKELDTNNVNIKATTIKNDFIKLITTLNKVALSIDNLPFNVIEYQNRINELKFFKNWGGLANLAGVTRKIEDIIRLTGEIPPLKIAYENAQVIFINLKKELQERNKELQAVNAKHTAAVNLAAQLTGVARTAANQAVTVAAQVVTAATTARNNARALVETIPPAAAPVALTNRDNAETALNDKRDDLKTAKQELIDFYNNNGLNDAAKQVEILEIPIKIIEHIEYKIDEYLSKLTIQLNVNTAEPNPPPPAPAVDIINKDAIYTNIKTIIQKYYNDNKDTNKFVQKVYDDIFSNYINLINTKIITKKIKDKYENIDLQKIEEAKNAVEAAVAAAAVAAGVAPAFTRQQIDDAVDAVATASDAAAVAAAVAARVAIDAVIGGDINATNALNEVAAVASTSPKLLATDNTLVKEIIEIDLPNELTTEKTKKITENIVSDIADIVNINRSNKIILEVFKDITDIKYYEKNINNFLDNCGSIENVAKDKFTTYLRNIRNFVIIPDNPVRPIPDPNNIIHFIIDNILAFTGAPGSTIQSIKYFSKNIFQLSIVKTILKILKEIIPYSQDFIDFNAWYIIFERKILDDDIYKDLNKEWKKYNPFKYVFRKEEEINEVDKKFKQGHNIKNTGVILGGTLQDTSSIKKNISSGGTNNLFKKIDKDGATDFLIPLEIVTHPEIFSFPFHYSGFKGINVFDLIQDGAIDLKDKIILPVGQNIFDWIGRLREVIFTDTSKDVIKEAARITGPAISEINAEQARAFALAHGPIASDLASAARSVELPASAARDFALAHGPIASDIASTARNTALAHGPVASDLASAARDFVISGPHDIFSNIWHSATFLPYLTVSGILAAPAIWIHYIINSLLVGFIYDLFKSAYIAMKTMHEYTLTKLIFNLIFIIFNTDDEIKIFTALQNIVTAIFLNYDIKNYSNTDEILKDIIKERDNNIKTNEIINNNKAIAIATFAVSSTCNINPSLIENLAINAVIAFREYNLGGLIINRNATINGINYCIRLIDRTQVDEIIALQVINCIICNYLIDPTIDLLDGIVITAGTLATTPGTTQVVTDAALAVVANPLVNALFDLPGYYHNKYLKAIHLFNNLTDNIKNIKTYILTASMLYLENALPVDTLGNLQNALVNYTNISTKITKLNKIEDIETKIHDNFGNPVVPTLVDLDIFKRILSIIGSNFKNYDNMVKDKLKDIGIDLQNGNNILEVSNLLRNIGPVLHVPVPDANNLSANLIFFANKNYNLLTKENITVENSLITKNIISKKIFDFMKKKYINSIKRTKLKENLITICNNFDKNLFDNIENNFDKNDIIDNYITINNNNIKEKKSTIYDILNLNNDILIETSFKNDILNVINQYIVIMQLKEYIILNPRWGENWIRKLIKRPINAIWDKIQMSDQTKKNYIDIIKKYTVNNEMIDQFDDHYLNLLYRRVTFAMAKKYTYDCMFNPLLTILEDGIERQTNHPYNIKKIERIINNSHDENKIDNNAFITYPFITDTKKSFYSSDCWYHDRDDIFKDFWCDKTNKDKLSDIFKHIVKNGIICNNLNKNKNTDSLIKVGVGFVSKIFFEKLSVQYFRKVFPNSNYLKARIKEIYKTIPDDKNLFGINALLKDYFLNYDFYRTVKHILIDNFINKYKEFNMNYFLICMHRELTKIFDDKFKYFTDKNINNSISKIIASQKNDITIYFNFTQQRDLYDINYNNSIIKIIENVNNQIIVIKKDIDELIQDKKIISMYEKFIKDEGNNIKEKYSNGINLCNTNNLHLQQVEIIYGKNEQLADKLGNVLNILKKIIENSIEIYAPSNNEISTTDILLLFNEKFLKKKSLQLQNWNEIKKYNDTEGITVLEKNIRDLHFMLSKIMIFVRTESTNIAPINKKSENIEYINEIKDYFKFKVLTEKSNNLATCQEELKTKFLILKTLNDNIQNLNTENAQHSVNIKNYTQVILNLKSKITSTKQKGGFYNPHSKYQKIQDIHNSHSEYQKIQDTYNSESQEIQKQQILLNPITIIILLKIIRITLYFKCLDNKNSLNKTIIIDLVISFILILSLSLFVDNDHIEYILADVFTSFIFITIINLLLFQEKSDQDDYYKQKNIQKSIISLLILLPYNNII
jgi:hypothetical protein